MNDRMARMLRLRGFRITLSGIALIFITSLPMMYARPDLGIFLLFIYSVIFGACAIGVGCLLLAIQSSRNAVESQSKFATNIASSLLLFIGVSIVMTYYVRYVLAAVPNGQIASMHFANDLGVVQAPEGFYFHHVGLERQIYTFTMLNNISDAILFIHITLDMTPPAGSAPCDTAIRDNAVHMQALKYYGGQIHDVEKSVSFYAARRLYRVESQASVFDPPSNFRIPAASNASLISVAKQLCAGAASPQAAEALRKAAGTP